jgi:hypothetical protein
MAAGCELAEQMAQRLAGVAGDLFQALAGGKAAAMFPFADGGHGKAEFHGDLFQRNFPLPPPAAECGGEMAADPTRIARSDAHTGFQQKCAGLESRNWFTAPAGAGPGHADTGFNVKYISSNQDALIFYLNPASVWLS